MGTFRLIVPKLQRMNKNSHLILLQRPRRFGLKKEGEEEGAAARIAALLARRREMGLQLALNGSRPWVPLVASATIEEREEDATHDVDLERGH